ncbi:hypothetical protein M9H77_16496 [Catharanthus roseus]|uniref:Uncharacterized protein n=1 Tax=Catharanthus roseus TaxID=4058 RepID=A0ACC0B1Y4_CATRO|nr:hypothetical protein M9H77_16496 [Catharanthus roseus]
MEEVSSHVHPGPIVPDAVVHGSFGGCTTDRGSLNHSIDLGVVAYTCIAASTDFGCSGRPSCSFWRYIFIWLPYLDRALVPSDLWRADVPLICYEIVDLHGLSIHHMHVILVLTCIRSSLGGMTTLTGGHNMLAK